WRRPPRMKSDRAKKVVPLGPGSDAFQAFFDMVESPAAVCDDEMTLITANPAFELLCGSKGVAGQALSALLEGDASAPPEGPGRTFCVRIIDQRTCALTSLYAEGRLREGARDVIFLKKTAAEKTHLLTHVLPADRVRIIDDDVPLLFVGSVRSICAPLVASGHL